MSRRVEIGARLNSIKAVTSLMPTSCKKLDFIRSIRSRISRVAWYTAGVLYSMKDRRWALYSRPRKGGSPRRRFALNGGSVHKKYVCFYHFWNYCKENESMEFELLKNRIFEDEF